MRRIQRVLTLLAGMAFAAARGAEYYVAIDGNDTAAGTATNTAWRTLQTSVNRLQAGDTLWVRGGTYRGKVTYTNPNGRADAPIRVRGYPGEQAVLKGSVLATGWLGPSNGVWRLPGWNFNSQQVFIDGQRLTQLGWPNDWTKSVACGCSSWVYIPFGTDCRRIGSTGMGFDFPEYPAAMPAGSFWYEAATGTLHVRPFDGADLNTRVVEVSKDLGVFYDTSGKGFLHLENLSFAHSSTFNVTQQGWPLVQTGPDSLVRNCEITDGDGTGLWLSRNSRAENCLIADHGMSGVSMSNSTGWMIDSCVVSGNNYRHINTEYAGGMKFIPDCAGIVQNCEVRDNFGSGIWFDWCNSGKTIVVRNNVILRNSAATGRNIDISKQAVYGVFIEVSSNADVYGNVISGNACFGIGVAGSRNVRAFNNTIHDTRGVAGGGAAANNAIILFRGVPTFPLENVEAFNNLMVDNVCSADLVVSNSDGFAIRNVLTDYNHVYRSVPGGGLSSTARAVFASANVVYVTLESWRAGTGYDLNSRVAPPLLDASLRPLAGSPVIDAGKADIPAWIDAEGLRGTDGDGDGQPRPDIGAHEWLPPGARVLHVDAAGTAPAAPYTNRTTAATNLVDALAVAAANDIVLVEPGLYPVAAELVLDRPVLIRGVARASGAAVLAATASNRIFRVDHPGALLENLTLRNGRAATGGGALLLRGRVQDCVVENGAAGQGGGVWAASGTVVRATSFTGCSATEAGGAIWLAAGALADSCTMTACIAAGEGGGAYVSAGAVLRAATLRQNTAVDGAGAMLAGGRAEKCLFDRNTASGEGGGAGAGAGAEIVNSRFFDNVSATRGGGLRLDGGSSAVNSLFLRNRSAEGGALWLADAGVSYCTLADNTATVRGGGLFAGAGAQVSATITHFNTAPVDPQAAVGDPSAVFAHMGCPTPLPGAGHVTGDPLFVNRAGGDFRLTWGSPCIDAAPSSGAPAADLDLYERPRNGNADGVAVADMGAFENVAVHYVDAAAPAPARPYANWQTAARSIQDAVNYCRSGDVLLVAPGTYPLTSSVSIGSSITVLATGGPETTILDGQNITRCVTMSHTSAVMEGFTLRRGRAAAGGGAYVRNGTLRRCIVTECVSTGDLGGAYAYLTANFPNPCTAGSDGTLKEGGGGVALVSGGLLENSLVHNNTSVRGGGLVLTRGGEARHCTVTGNSASIEGGGAALITGGKLVNSIVWDNLGGVSSNLFLSGTQPVVRHTCAAPVPAGTGNFAAVPGWTGSADLYRLPAFSPCLDRGEPSSTLLDLSGAPRPQDGDADGTALPDPGAWERVRLAGDADGDGLTDVEEEALGTSPLLADTDGDFVPDPEELLLGTDPVSATSYIKLLSPMRPASGDGYTLRWRSSSRHVYSIARGTNLLEGITGVIATNLPPTAPWNEYTDPDAIGPGPFYYRIEGRESPSP